jgi:hypothetical protein
MASFLMKAMGTLVNREILWANIFLKHSTLALFTKMKTILHLPNGICIFQMMQKGSTYYNAFGLFKVSFEQCYDPQPVTP